MTQEELRQIYESHWQYVTQNELNQYFNFQTDDISRYLNAIIT